MEQSSFHTKINPLKNSNSKFPDEQANSLLQDSTLRIDTTII